MEYKELLEILDLHKKYLNDIPGGECANLSGADLSGVNLRYTNLRGANLRGSDLPYADLRSADLTCADLRGADLWGAELRDANLSGVDLRGSDLRGVNLRCANLRGADLRSANLRGADLRGADLTYADLRYIIVSEDTKINYPPLACPEKGSFIGYKKAYLCKPAGESMDDNIIWSDCIFKYIPFIVELRITEDALRNSATGRKCRCSKAEVLSITNLDGSITSINEVYSKFDPDFIYKVGETIEVNIFNTDRFCECAPGIHFFITREEAVNYRG